MNEVTPSTPHGAMLWTWKAILPPTFWIVDAASRFRGVVCQARPERAKREREPAQLRRLYIGHTLLFAVSPYLAGPHVWISHCGDNSKKSIHSLTLTQNYA